MPRPADPNTKIDLLRAAEEVFAERGLVNAKIDEITRRAGHSKGSFYLHFSSKEDAFRQIIESTLARLAAHVDDAHVDIGARLPPAEYVARWRAHDLEMFEFVWANRRVIKLMMEGGGAVSFNYLIDQFAERSRAQCARSLALGIQHGLYRRDLDVETASLLLAGGYDRVARELVRADKKPDLQRMLAAVQRVVLGGVASPKLLAVLDSKVTKVGARSPRARAARPVRRRMGRG